jgi:hypothetical protein
MTATFVAALTLAIGGVPTAVASPSTHTNARNPAARVLFAGRGYRLVVPVVEVATSRPPRTYHTEPSSDRRDDARTTRDPQTADRAAVVPFGKERQDTQRCPDATATIVPSKRGRSFLAAALLAMAGGAYRTVGEAVFHEAHAPPRHS